MNELTTQKKRFEEVNLYNGYLATGEISTELLWQRIAACANEDGVPLIYEDFKNKCKSNGITKVLKSLGLWIVIGRGENRRTFIHKKIKLILDTTCANAETVAKTVINLVEGKYIGMPLLDFEITEEYYNLISDRDKKYSVNVVYQTYIMHNKVNGLYKIGKSCDIKRRVKQVSKVEDAPIDVICVHKKDIESELHIKFDYCRQFGEWFSLSQNDILDIMNEYGFKDYKRWV